MNGNLTTGSGYAVYWECIFHILKYRDYKKCISVKIMLRRYCYHLNLPMVIIHRGQEISQYGYFGEEGKTCLQRQNGLLTNQCLSINTF